MRKILFINNLKNFKQQRMNNIKIFKDFFVILLCMLSIMITFHLFAFCSLDAGGLADLCVCDHDADLDIVAERGLLVLLLDGVEAGPHPRQDVRDVLGHVRRRGCTLTPPAQPGEPPDKEADPEKKEDPDKKEGEPEKKEEDRPQE